MLIIFDLDDTLIDTSGFVTPFKLRSCVDRLVSEGLRVPDLERAYSELLFLNQSLNRSQDAISQFISNMGGEARLVPVALEEMFSSLPQNFTIPTTPFAKEILNLFRERYSLALVTGGRSYFQLEKLEKAGIDRSIFSKIAIAEDSVKKPFYEALLKEFSLMPHQVFVCGDRIAMDLLPAFELGIKTVHMRWGRGKQMVSEKWIDHSISDLSQLRRIIET